MAARQYQRFEKGEQKPGFDNLRNMADFYGVSVDWLMGRTERREVWRESAAPLRPCRGGLYGRPGGDHKGRPYAMIRCDGPVPQRPTPQGGLSCPSGAIHLLPKSARLVPGWRALHVTFLTHDFWSCLRRAPFWAARKGRKSRLRRGIPISPALTIHPLKRPRRGNCDSPFLELPPGCSADDFPAAGAYAVTPPPHRPGWGETGIRR